MRLLRGLVLLVGFGVVGVLGTAEWALRRRDRGLPHVADGSGLDQMRELPDPPVTRTVARLRVALGALGVLVTVFGVYVVLRDVAPASYLGLAIWLAAAVVLHDAVLVPSLTVLRAAARRAGRRAPAAAVGLAEAGFLVGGAVTLLAVPEIWAKHLGTLNPTVLPGSYGQALLVTWMVVLALTVVAVAAVVLRARRATGVGAPRVTRSPS